MSQFWPLSRSLFFQILNDECSDHFVNERIWERLGYKSQEDSSLVWLASDSTPNDWITNYPIGPDFIGSRPPSVRLTKSIPKEYKQSLKLYLNFGGYKIGALYPRLTRRATAVNWLLAWQIKSFGSFNATGPMAPTLLPPVDPSIGHSVDRAN